LSVGEAVVAATDGLPAQIRQLLTWDCGTEMAGRARSTGTGLQVFLAHPHSRWERGSHENPNRIVREFFPKVVPINADPTYLAGVATDRC
jgi:IS30 family transposase